MTDKSAHFSDRREGGLISFVAEVILVSFLIFYSIARSVFTFILPCKKYKDISNEIVLITGGGKGLGRVLAVEFAKFNPKHVSTRLALVYKCRCSSKFITFSVVLGSRSRLDCSKIYHGWFEENNVIRHVKFWATFTSKLMSNLATKINQTSVEINGKLHFIKFGMSKLLETLETVSDVKINIFQTTIFNELKY